ALQKSRARQLVEKVMSPTSDDADKLALATSVGRQLCAETYFFWAPVMSARPSIYAGDTLAVALRFPI
ncbi:MAG: hypothetical protein NT028_14225, partial [candidate division Zixibacteria bacterium]|nr:hypothetical protein [candidate division Zixibacteria bacterium]